MARIEVYPETLLPQNVIELVRNVSPAVRGVSPEVDAGRIVCGRLSLKPVLEVLHDHGIKTGAMFLDNKHGGSTPMQDRLNRRRPVLRERTPLPENAVVFDPQELQYKRLINGIQDQRKAHALDTALGLTVEAVRQCIGQTPLRPCDLVGFTEKGPSFDDYKGVYPEACAALFDLIRYTGNPQLEPKAEGRFLSHLEVVCISVPLAKHFAALANK